MKNKGSVRSLAVLKVVGVNHEGLRKVLRVSCSLSEAKVHSRAFLEGLVKRGLHGVELITSDSHSGLRSAIRAVFPSVRWQKRLFHLAQNASAQAPKASMRQEICKAVKEIYQPVDKAEAEARLQKIVKAYKKKARKFCD